jgi:predicted enzyme related to lactoylglutathione lyase
MFESVNPFIWYELLTSDKPAAERFYRDVVGWGAKDSGVPGVDYTLLTIGDDGVAGLMTLPPEAAKMGARPGWIGYLGVADTDATVAKVIEAGGRVCKEAADIPGVGRFAVMADPQGTVFAMIAPPADCAPPPCPPPGHPGTTGWHELMAADLASAWMFYAKQFGWTQDHVFETPMGPYQIFRTGGEPIGGMMTKPAAMPAPFWIFYFNVEALDAAIDRVLKAGGQVLNGPMEVPGGSWIAQCSDPQGAMFAIVSQKR